MTHRRTYAEMHSYVLDWYADNKRILPWRDTFDPYMVLVSETMLQQTQVERVIPKFHTRMDALPTFDALAEASTEDLLRLWSGLWFNSRVLRLQQAAQLLLERFDGVLPRDRDLLQTLPGVWPYTSAALLAFVYNLPAPVVDTNIRRVYIWLLSLDVDISDRALEAIVEESIPEHLANDWFNALMDIGATLLTSKKTWIKPRSQQSRFAGSPRQTRGAVVRHLLHHGPTWLDVLRREYAHPQFIDIIAWLEKEGMIVCDENVCKIA